MTDHPYTDRVTVSEDHARWASRVAMDVFGIEDENQELAVATARAIEALEAVEGALNRGGACSSFVAATVARYFGSSYVLDQADGDGPGAWLLRDVIRFAELARVWEDEARRKTDEPHNNRIRLARSYARKLVMV